MHRYKLPRPGFQPLPPPPVVQDFLDRFEAACLARYDFIAGQKPCVANNLGPGQVEALRMLRQRDDIVIKPADKNLGLTVMRAADCHAALQKHVSGTTTCKIVTDELPQLVLRTRKQLCELVERYRDTVWDGHTCEFLLQGVEMVIPPFLYLLPKLHKMCGLDSPLVGRPIAACHSWGTHMHEYLVGRFAQSVLEGLPHYCDR